MSTLYLTFGLPASGKSTWAKAFVKQSKQEIAYISQDEVAKMVEHIQKPAYDSYLTKRIVLNLIQDGMNVLVDTMVFDNLYEYAHMANNYQMDLKIARFDDVSLQTCLERNSHRSDNNKVDESIIRDFHQDMTTLLQNPDVIRMLENVTIMEN